MTTFAPRERVPLAGLTTIGVGGPARWFVTATCAADVRTSHAWCRTRGLPLWVLGGGSNVVLSDAGFDGLVMHVAIAGSRSEVTRDRLMLDAGAGEPWDAVVERLVADGWAGAECLSGIPGTVGGTPIQNVGAYGQEVASIVDTVQAFDGDTAEMVEIPAAECGFSYRHSRFKNADAGRFVICGVRFRMTRQAPTLTYPDVQRWLAEQRIASPGVGDVRAAVLAIRRSKGMVADGSDPDARSVGSFFMNPVIALTERERLAAQTGRDVPARPVGDGRVRVPAAWLIERAGWVRGDADGPVAISSKHPLAIVNRGGASAADVVEFAVRVKRRVADRLGVWLQPEPVFVGFDGAGELADLEYLRKAHP
jgi:UDP-N-acetylmuramate dehydrogenase